MSLQSTFMEGNLVDKQLRSCNGCNWRNHKENNNFNSWVVLHSSYQGLLRRGSQIVWRIWTTSALWGAVCEVKGEECMRNAAVPACPYKRPAVPAVYGSRNPPANPYAYSSEAAPSLAGSYLGAPVSGAEGEAAVCRFWSGDTMDGGERCRELVLPESFLFDGETWAVVDIGGLPFVIVWHDTDAPPVQESGMETQRGWLLGKGMHAGCSFLYYFFYYYSFIYPCLLLLVCYFCLGCWQAQGPQAFLEISTHPRPTKGLNLHGHYLWLTPKVLRF